jgi:hypothetical protein
MAMMVATCCGDGDGGETWQGLTFSQAQGGKMRGHRKLRFMRLFCRFSDQNAVPAIIKPFGLSRAFRRTEPGRAGDLPTIAPSRNPGATFGALALGGRLDWWLQEGRNRSEKMPMIYAIGVLG